MLTGKRSRSIGLVAALCLVIAACGDGTATTTTAQPPGTTTSSPGTTTPTTTTPPSAFEEIERLAREEGFISLFSTVDEPITAAVIAAFNEVYPEIEVVHTLLVSADAQARFASEREANALSADVLIVGDHLLYDARPDWFVPFTEEEIPNLSFLADNLNGGHFIDFMAAPYVFQFNTDLVTEPPVEWTDMLEDRFLGIGGTLVDPRASGAFMVGYDFWRELYGDEFLIDLGNAGFTWESSPSQAREKIAAGTIAFTTPGVGAPMLAFIDAGAPVNYQTMIPSIALPHAAAISNVGNINAGLVFLNFLLTERGQETACAPGYEYLADHAEVPNCPKAPEGIRIGNATDAMTRSEEILALLGLDD